MIIDILTNKFMKMHNVALDDERMSRQVFSTPEEPLKSAAGALQTLNDTEY